MNLNKFENKEILDHLEKQFGETIQEAYVDYDILSVYVPAAKAKEVIQWLKEDEQLKLHFLTNIAGIHYPDNEGSELEVIYQLHSLENHIRLRVKSKLPIAKPEIASIVDVYVGANWMERETYDFFGIIFKGHPKLIKILNMEDQDYFPLRKEYPLEDPKREDKDNRFFGR